MSKQADRALDLEVHKIFFGLTSGHFAGDTWGGNSTVGSAESYTSWSYCRYCQAYMPNGFLDGDCAHSVPYYSSDIAVAWMIVDELSKMATDTVFLKQSILPRGWTAQYNAPDPLVAVWADTPALALCLLALEIKRVSI